MAPESDNVISIHINTIIYVDRIKAKIYKQYSVGSYVI